MKDPRLLDAKKEPDKKINEKFLICCTLSADKDKKCRLFLFHDEILHINFAVFSKYVTSCFGPKFCCSCICFKSLRFVSVHFKFLVFLMSFSTSSFFSLKYKGNAVSTRPVMTKLFLLAVSSVSSLKFVHYALKHTQFIRVRFCTSNGAELIIIIK